MELDDLSPAQRRIANGLSALVAPPNAEVRERLLVAIRAAPGAAATDRPPFLSGWRRLALLSSATLVLVGVGAGSTLALTAHALPGSPAYSIRLTGEHLRLRLAGPAEADRLRVTFARERIEEARTDSRGDRGVIETLLQDSSVYLGEAQHDLQNGQVDQGTRGQLEREIGNVQTQEGAVEGQYGIQDKDGHQGPAPQQFPGGSEGVGATGTPSGAGAGGDNAGYQQPGGSPSTGPPPGASPAVSSSDVHGSSGTGDSADRATSGQNSEPRAA